MSAWLCSADHISLLASNVMAYGVARPKGHTVEQVFATLLHANVRSLIERYGEGAEDDRKTASGYEYDPGVESDHVVLLKQISCYSYQSCEGDDFRTGDEAHDMMHRLRCRLFLDPEAPWADQKVREKLRLQDSDKVEGYDEAPWGI